LIGLAILIALIAVLGYGIAPGIVKRSIEEELTTLLGRKTTLGEVQVHPFTLTVRLRDFRIAQADGAASMLDIQEIEAGLSLASVLHLAPVVNRLHVSRPKLAITRLSPDRFDFSDILDRLGAFSRRVPEKPADSKPARFSINNIEFTDGLVTFDDRVSHSQHRLESLTLSLPFISNLPHDVELFVEPAFSVKVDGSLVALKGRLKPFEQSLETVVDLNVTGLDLPTYVGFSPVAFTPRLVSGLLSTDLEVGFRRDADASPHVRLSGTTSLEKLRIDKPDGSEVLAAERIALDLKNVDLSNGDIELNSLEVLAPSFAAERLADGRIDVLELFAPAPAAAGHPAPSSPPAMAAESAAYAPATAPGASSPKPANKPARLWLGEFRLSGATVHFQDHSAALPFVVNLSDLHASATGLSNEPGSKAQIELGLSTAPGQTIGLKGQASLAEKSLSGHIELANLHLESLAGTFGALLAARLDSGILEAATEFDLKAQDSPPSIKLSHLALAVHHLQLRLPDEHEPVLVAERVAIDNTTVDLEKPSIQIEKLTLAGVSASVVRNALGVINVSTLAVPPRGGTAHQARAAAEPAQALSQTKPSDAPRGEFGIGKIEVSESKLAFADENVRPAAALHLEKISFSAENLKLNGAAHIPFQFAALANRKGRIELKGDLAPAPFALNAELSCRTIPLAALQGYLGDRLNITISNADLSVRGALKIATESASDVRFRGSAELTDFAALDKLTSADFLRWKSLLVPGISAHLPLTGQPASVELGDVVLSDFFSRLIVYPDGRLNVQNLVAPVGSTGPQSVTNASTPPPEAPPESAVATEPNPPAGAATVLRLNSLKLAHGTVNYTDNFVKPNYTTNITNLDGSVSKVASDNPEPAAVSLKGSLEGNGDLEITGSVNPLVHPLYLDIAANATNIELTRLTPYSVKYAGYNIEKGKLSMKVKYHIENNQLDAQNNLFLDQLTFGEHVDSPTATKLPVLFAIGLLKDVNGQINIDLPVSGSLSDPQFSIGGVIVRVIVNLLEKALLSPFQLLGSIGGGEGGDLGYVEFEPGQAQLGPAGQAKVAKLAGILASRPALKLDIIGRADRATDTDAAREARLSAKVQGVKYRELLKSDPNTTFESVSVTPSEYPEYLETVYREADFEKPKNVVGLTKSLPPAQMEQLLRSNMPVNDEDLLGLADRRAAAVRDALVQSGKVPTERLFIVASKLMSDAPQDKGSPNRVDFALH
jgi:uncharacterized protein involved in outer membrane biogenesis